MPAWSHRDPCWRDAGKSRHVSGPLADPGGLVLGCPVCQATDAAVPGSCFPHSFISLSQALNMKLGEAAGSSAVSAVCSRDEVSSQDRRLV